MIRRASIWIGLLGIVLVILGLVVWVFPRNYFSVELLRLDDNLGIRVPGYVGNQVKDISIRWVYFVPQNKTEISYQNWKSVLEDASVKLSKFYELQLNNKIRIYNQVTDHAVIGHFSHVFYDTFDTNKGNPQALLSISKELSERNYEFNHWEGTSPFKVWVVVYEGVGASATQILNSEYNLLATSTLDTVFVTNLDEAFVLVSRSYFTDKANLRVGMSVLAHEFGHVLGLPDNYNLETGKSVDDDIMGSGRFDPIESAFLSEDSKSKLGIGGMR